jgi:hypothetical protein
MSWNTWRPDADAAAATPWRRQPSAVIGPARRPSQFAVDPGLRRKPEFFLPNRKSMAMVDSRLLMSQVISVSCRILRRRGEAHEIVVSGR